MPDTSAKIIAALTAAAEGLLVPSEQDVALALFRWPQRQQLTPARLVAALGRPPATPVTDRCAVGVGIGDGIKNKGTARLWQRTTAADEAPNNKNPPICKQRC